MNSSRQLRSQFDGSFFQVLVIGGGINGAAIARECARAGARALLVEQHDFASGTTSRSTRIIHGGLRYLEHAELGLVRESLRERDRMLARYPHLVRPLRFVLALDPEGGRSALAVRAGLWLYQRILAPSGARTSQARRSGEFDLQQFERQLDQGRRWSVFDYEDAQCEFPERLVAEWIAEAESAGAVVLNYTRALAVELRDHRVAGVRLRDEQTGEEFRITCSQVVNASGPWADEVCAASGVNTGAAMIGGVRGSHIVLPLPGTLPKAAVYTEAADRRAVFLIPWNNQLLIGTTEVPDSGDPGRSRPCNAEIEYLLASARRVLTTMSWSQSDIRYAFSGVRPLPNAPGANLSAISRRHRWHDHAEDGAAGMLSLIGGKLTTAAEVGREGARKIGLNVKEPKATPSFMPAAWKQLAAMHANHLAESGKVSPQTAAGILEWFGGRAAAVAQLAAEDPSLRLPLCPHSQHIVAEAVFSAHREHALTLSDMLLRRTPVALGACWNCECTRTAAERIAAALEWSPSKMVAEIQAFEEERSAFLPQRART